MVQPQLHAAYNDGEYIEDEHTLTYWLLDDDPLSRLNDGALDRLLRHIHHISRETQGSRDTQLRITLAAGVDRAILTFGSSHAFTNSLFSAELSQVNVIAFAFLSLQNGWFVPEYKCDETGNNQGEPNFQPKNNDGNSFDFRSSFSVYYLNTKYDHMECFIESYPCFGSLTYKTFVQESLLWDANSSKYRSLADSLLYARVIQLIISLHSFLPSRNFHRQRKLSTVAQYQCYAFIFWGGSNVV